MKTKKIPLRKCISCGEGKPKKDLTRIVRSPENVVAIDITGKMNGRGAYLCSNIDCITSAKKTKKLSRALEVEIPENIYDNLLKIVEEQL